MPLNTFETIQPMINPLFSKELTSSGISCLLKTPPSPHIDIKLDLDQTLDELIEKITTLKQNYENELSYSLCLKEILNKKYQVSINEILQEFSKEFQKKKEDIITALYILDYVGARDAQIDIFKRKDGENYKYPTKRNGKDSVFNEKSITDLSKPGQARKLYYSIKKILQLPNPL